MPPYIIPAQPKLRTAPPRGTAWLHEVKFDGYRLQLHAHSAGVRLLSRNGHDVTARFAPLIAPLAALPCRSVILDAEVIATRDDGVPDFWMLHRRQFGADDLVACCFDLLWQDDEDVRSLPLSERRTRLEALLGTAPHPALQLSPAFNDGAALLAACEARGLEGIVSKKKTAAYRSGRCDWVKVKTDAWRRSNRQRFRAFAAR